MSAISQSLVAVLTAAFVLLVLGFGWPFIRSFTALAIFAMILFFIWKMVDCSGAATC